MRYIGVDISKSKLNLAWAEGDVWHKLEIANDSSSIQQWVKGLAHEDIQVVFEATGSYGSRLAYLLDLNGKPFTVLNPSQSKGFSQVQKSQNHTDERDAVALAEYGSCIRPQATALKAEHWERLRQLRRALRQLRKYERMLRNQIHALEQFPCPEPTVAQALGQVLSAATTQITALEHQICSLTDEEMRKMSQKLTQIKGIGPVAAREMLIATDGFQNFESAKQVAKFIGISPTSKSSGSSVRKKGKISRSGDSAVRGVLYMAALSASRCNHACKELYKRLKDKGKSTKQALVAVAHKLLRQAFGVIKSAQDFDNDYYKKFQTT